MGGESLWEEDQYLLEINLGNMEMGAIWQQEYWLWAIDPAKIKQIADKAAGIG